MLDAKNYNSLLEEDARSLLKKLEGEYNDVKDALAITYGAGFLAFFFFITRFTVPELFMEFPFFNASVRIGQAFCGAVLVFFCLRYLFSRRR